VDDRLLTNRANWDERIEIHLQSRFYNVERWLREAPAPRSYEAEALGDVAGLRLLHLQCHFGLDTLTWARAGAEVTGLDFSANAVDAARALAERAGLGDRATFVCADVYDAVEALHHATFDVVYVSLGALTWLPTVERWAEQVGALVAPGGRFYIHDGHPVVWALSDDGLSFEHSYFEETEPFVDDTGATYSDAERVIGSARTYEWNHAIGEIVTALVSNGLHIDRLVEYDWTVWPRFPWLVADAEGRWSSPPGTPRIPLSFSLLASLPRDASA
jgi:SAM-dependent methyltransferase